ncbi:wax ester/triacylglycerol synthase family O-acyltransferase [Rhodococcus sp. NPDC058514]|uniref:WS/DGAT/MGAT family O-acyltransferase n=1 Tax=unclassified Rhodococcus (in: high G+C Gram-positive bacteria) TaxID=192944 RepID=UPI003664948E
MLLPMSPADSMWLLAESREHPMHVGGLQLFEPPEGADAADLRGLFDAAIANDTAAQRFRQRATRSWSSLGQWAWEEDGGFELGYHVRHDALPQPGGMRELLDLCAQLHAAPMDRHRPLWEMHLIEGLRDGRFAVYTKVHHAVSDGVSAMRMLVRSLSEDPTERAMPTVWDTGYPAQETHVSEDPTAETEDHGGVLGLPISAARAAAEMVGGAAAIAPAVASTVARALREQGGSLSFAAPNTILNVPIAGARRYAARSWPIERLRLIAKAVDATVNDIVLAMCSGGLRTFMLSLDALPELPLIAAVPVSLRGSSADEPVSEGGDSADEPAGNSFGILMCNLATHLADPAQRLETVRTSMLEGKESLTGMRPSQILAMSAVGMAPAALHVVAGSSGAVRPPFNVVISNVPGPRTPRYWNGARLDGLYPIAFPADGQALNITCTSCDDTIAFGLTGCRRALPDLDPLLDHLDDELRALETAVGL